MRDVLAEPGRIDRQQQELSMRVLECVAEGDEESLMHVDQLRRYFESGNA